MIPKEGDAITITIKNGHVRKVVGRSAPSSLHGSGSTAACKQLKKEGWKFRRQVGSEYIFEFVGVAAYA